MGRRPVVVAVVLAIPLSVAIPMATSPAGANLPIRMVSRTEGLGSANGPSIGGNISADGRRALFTSSATNIARLDRNGHRDVFVRFFDSPHQSVEIVSKPSAFSTTLANGDSGVGVDGGGAAISPEGSSAVYSSSATNLVTGDTNALDDVFVSHVPGLASGDDETVRVSVASDGTQGNGHSGGHVPGSGPAISGNGHVVAFTSRASNLVQSDTNGTPDVFVRDLLTRSTTRVSVPTGGGQARGSSHSPSLSADGRYVVFSSTAGNLVPGDTNGASDVFLRDRVAGTTVRVSVGAGGSQPALGASRGSLNTDGNFVVFVSKSADLVQGDTNGVSDVFVRDLSSGATERISTSTEGIQGDADSGGNIAVSADGMRVAFDSLATTLVPDSSPRPSVYLRDRRRPSTERLSLSQQGVAAKAPARVSGMSPDGRFVTFTSDGGRIVWGDINGVSDAFVSDRQGAPATTPFGDFDGDGWSDVMAVEASSGRFFLYPGSGGGWLPRRQVGTGWNSMNAVVRLGDFDRRGHEDVIAREKATGRLWLYRGNGSGFSSRVLIGGGNWNTMREITAVGDFDGDHYNDLMAVHAVTGYLYLYSGRGSSLTTPQRIGTSWNLMSELVATDDFDRDGHLDLLARRTSTGELWVYLGAARYFYNHFRVASGFKDMRDLLGVGDLDRDGNNDFLAVQNSTGRLLLHQERDEGFFLPGNIVGTGWATGLRPLT